MIDDNYNWLAKIKTIDFLRDIGKYFTVSYMLAKDAVKMRLESGFLLQNSIIWFYKLMIFMFV